MVLSPPDHLLKYAWPDFVFQERIPICGFHRLDAFHKIFIAEALMESAKTDLSSTLVIPPFLDPQIVIPLADLLAIIGMFRVKFGVADLDRRIYRVVRLTCTGRPVIDLVHWKI